jgi:cation diffusion facilitator family transporter
MSGHHHHSLSNIRSDTKDPFVKLAYTEGLLSIVINTLLFALKYWAGIVSGSVAIIADAWHSLSDSLSSVFLLVGAKIASKPPDKEHPYGHGRAELIASILIAAFLGFVAYEFISDSIGRLSENTEAKFGTVAIVVTVVSILFKEALAQYAFWAGRKANSSAIRGDGWHHRTDAISSVLILIGIFIGRFFWWIDGILGIVVALMILYAAYEILKDAINNLMGVAPNKKLTDQVVGVATAAIGFDPNIHHIHLHTYGNHQELTFHIRLPNKMDVETSHTITKSIEKSIKVELGMVATIHVEPETDQISEK